nr:RNA recognition motif and Polyprenyl synthetase domain containing protein [Haemonchus contortus]
MSDEDVGDNEAEDMEMDGVPEDLDAKIANVREQLAQNSFDFELNNELLSLLRKNGDFDELAEAREKIAAQHPLSSTSWLEWIQDERSSGSEQNRVEELFDKAVFDCNSLDVWMELVQWACGVSPKFAREKFEAALSAIGLRVDVGAMIWQSYLCFEEAMLGGAENLDEQRKCVASLYKRALRVPNVDLADTWKSYLDFAGEQVDEDIRRVYETSVNDMKEFSKYELKLAETDDSLEAFHEYLDYEKEKDDPARIQAFYNRMLDKHHQNENVWFDYGQWCETRLKVHSITCRVYKQAVRHCPYSCALWQQTLLALERSGAAADEIDEFWEKARETISSADDGRALYRTYIYILRRRADSTEKDYTKVAEIFEEGSRNLVEWFGKHDWDPQGVYRRNWAYFAYNKLKDFQKGKKIWDDILASGGGRFADKWIEAVRLERQFGSSDDARKLLYKALNSVSDHPNTVFEYFIQFEREEGTLEQLDKALEKVNAQAVQRASRVQAQKPKEESAGKKPHGKERRGAVDKHEPNDSSRKRAGSTLEEVVATKKQATEVVKPNPSDQNVPKDKDGFAMPMLPVKKSTAPVPSPSASSGQPTTSTPPSDKEQKFTVFISNLDFKTTPEQVKKVLNGVLDVRLVYRGMSKLTKGYGFVDLDSKESYEEALAKDRVPIEGRPMLISVNDPERRPTFKYSTDLEKTKLFVRNVHYDCTEDQLRDAFKVFGEVKAVRIVTHISGKPKGVAYVEFANEDDARKAVLEPEIILLDRKLHVAISNPPKKPAKEEAKQLSSTPFASTSTDRKAHLTMVPRGFGMVESAANGTRTSLDEEHLLAPFDYITSMPGKQIRGQLAMAFNIWLKIGTEELSEIMEIVQMLHNASLLVDDIEDNSVLRRGLPVTHHIYGTPRTINSANYVYFIALEKCTRLSHEAVRIFAEQMLELHRGQGKELFWRDTVTCPTEAEYEEMVVQKTGGLFFLAVKLMELFSNAKYDFCKLLRQMALFFQIRDDFMNLVSDEMAQQKSFAEDLTEGKFSFPIIHAIRNSPASSNDDPVLNILRQRTGDIEVKKYCIKLIKERHSLDYTLSRLRKISTDIRTEIKALGGNSKLEDVMDLLERGIVN